MALTLVPMAMHSYQDASLRVSAQQLVNWYVEQKPQGSKSPVALHGTPGLKLWSTVGSGPIRGIIEMGSYTYVVSGLEVYRVDVNKAATKMGNVTGFRPVSMAHNGEHVVIVSDYDVYYVSSTAFGTLSISGCQGVAFVDGYLLVAERGNQRWRISGLNDALTWSGLDFDLANAMPDHNMGIAISGRDVWVFGEKSVEIHYNSGAAAFPFARYPAGVVQRGCLSPRSIAELLGVLFWLGDDKRVYISDGHQATPISTVGIDQLIAPFTTHAASVGMTYIQRGHPFYCLTFPGEGSICYDVSTRLWHERRSHGRDDWRARSYAFAFGLHLTGDAANGNVYELDLATYTDNGDMIRRVMTAPPIHAGVTRVRMHSFIVEAEVGLGLVTGQGSDPQLMLDWSDDGARTWSNEHWRTMGTRGAYRTRVQWHRLGQFRSRVPRLTISDPIEAIVLQTWADVEGLAL